MFCVIILLRMGFYYRLPTLSPAPVISVWCVCFPPWDFPVKGVLRTLKLVLRPKLHFVFSSNYALWNLFMGLKLDESWGCSRGSAAICRNVSSSSSIVANLIANNDSNAEATVPPQGQMTEVIRDFQMIPLSFPDQLSLLHLSDDATSHSYPSSVHRVPLLLPALF